MSSMKTKMKATVAAVGLGLAMLSGAASANLVLYSPITTFEDDDVDFIVKGAGNTGGFGTLQVGDTLVSIIEVTRTSQPATANQAFVAPQELSGVAAVTLLGFADLDGIGGLNDMIFGAYAGGLNTFLGGKTVTGGGANGGATVALFLANSENLVTTGSTNCADRADCIARATDGVLFEVDGFAGDADEFWFALNAATDTAAVLLGNESAEFGAVNFGQSILDTGGNPFSNEGIVCTGPVAAFCAGNDRIGVLGSGTINGGAGLGAGVIADGAVAHSDFDFQKGLVVPEPGSLALAGLALLGLASVRRKPR